MDKLKKIEIDLKREISFILNSKVKDPRIGFITITDIKLSNDFHYLDIFFSVMDKDENLKKSLEGLNNCKGFIKKNIQERIKLKNIPEIKFIYDDSLDKGIRIQQILESIKTEKKS